MPISAPRLRAAIALLLSALLGIAVHFGWTQSLDVALLGRIRGVGGPVLLGPMIALTDIGSLPGQVVEIVAAALLLVATGRRGDAARLAGIAVAGRILIELIKLVVARGRPPLIQHAVAVTSWSFPSSHTANSTITFIALALFLAQGKAWGPALATAAMLAFAIGCSRMWLGVHWPTDVIAGWLFGIGWLALTIPPAKPRLP